jgi:hypothetical protein
VYGFQKAGGEGAVAEAFGDDAVFVRPGAILGPGEYVGRLPWSAGCSAHGFPSPGACSSLPPEAGEAVLCFGKCGWVLAGGLEREGD